MKPPTISAFVPVAPDADWETIRARVIDTLAVTAEPEWTDHNLPEPGVTVAEDAAMGLADLHFRTATRSLAAWPLDSTAWRADAAQHWYGTLDPTRMVEIATALATTMASGQSAVDELEPLIRACDSIGDALTLLGAEPWAAVIAPGLRTAVAVALRERRVRQVAHENSDVIAAAIASERARGGSVAERDARAAKHLALSVPLWPTELVAIVERERRMISVATITSRLEDIARGRFTSATELQELDVTAQDAAIALSAGPLAHTLEPEALETARGHTKVWPPHPVQSLTCEPVTASDYAARARSHPGVNRAWAAPGLIAASGVEPAIGWDGQPVLVTESSRQGAITLVIELDADTARTEHQLRTILTTAIGTEVTNPHPDWRGSSAAEVDESLPRALDVLEPRRMIGDAVGATYLKQFAVTVKAVLVTGPTVDRDATIDATRTRIEAFFTQGRPESRANVDPQGFDGPWPRVDQPSLGWNPGEAIRAAEITQVIASDPRIIGIKGLEIGGTGGWVDSTVGVLAVPLDAVPTLAEAQCLRVEFALRGECSDA